jgi:uncharacterized heparinase superfamily protein
MRRLLGSLADGFVTSPAFRWTWSAPEKASVKQSILELRPSDSHTVSDMMDGQYLMAQRLVDTGGSSPFAVDYGTDEWFAELHSFAWVRHFAAPLDEGSKKFAGTLTMDWVSRYGKFSPKVWDNEITALRVLNWLKHFDRLCYGLSEPRRHVVERSLMEQVQNLKVRINFEADPARRLLMRVALLGAAIAMQKPKADIEQLLDRTLVALKRQIDDSGMHRSRNIEQQFLLLIEMIPVRHAVTPLAPKRGKRFADVLEKMHQCLAMMMHTTGELSFFNNTRSVPHELLLAVQSRASSSLELQSGKLAGGYGMLLGANAKLLVDSGATMGEDFAGHLFAGGGSFEFSSRNDLIVTNCGPGPLSFGDDRELFRLPASHSTMEIEYAGPFPHTTEKVLKNHIGANKDSTLKVDLDDHRIDVKNLGFKALVGVEHHRSMNVLQREGDALLGQDRILCDMAHKHAPDEFLLRFHLGPGVKAEINEAQTQIDLTLRSGAKWVFIWEGATALIEASARYSAHKGLEEIEQIVLTTTAKPEQEVVWTFAPVA